MKDKLKPQQERRPKDCENSGRFPNCREKGSCINCSSWELTTTNPAPAFNEEDVVKEIGDAFDRGYAVAMGDIEDMGREKEKDCLKRIKGGREQVLDEIDNFAYAHQNDNHYLNYILLRRKLNNLRAQQEVGMTPAHQPQERIDEKGRFQDEQKIVTPKNRERQPYEREGGGDQCIKSRTH